MALSLNWQKGLWIGLITVLLVIIGSSIYYLLGGFKEVVVYELQGERRNIVGKYFKGYYAHPELEDIWNECRNRIQGGSLTGNLAVVNYQNDSLDNDEVEQFIGVALEGGMAEIPSNFEVLELVSERKLAVFLSMHPLVRPNPIRIERLFAAYAEENGLELEASTLEVHFADNSMTVESQVRQPY